jgi:hypothetical protein
MKYVIYILIFYISQIPAQDNAQYSNATQLLFHENGMTRCVISQAVNEQGRIVYLSILQIDKLGMQKAHHEIEPISDYVVRRLYAKSNSVDDAKNKGLVDPIMDRIDLKSLKTNMPLLTEIEFEKYIASRIVVK